MKIGLIGTGRIGAFHAETLKSLPGVDRIVVADATRPAHAYSRTPLVPRQPNPSPGCTRRAWTAW